MITYILVGMALIFPIAFIVFLCILFLTGAAGVPSSQYGRERQSKGYQKRQVRKERETLRNKNKSKGKNNESIRIL